MEKVQVETVGDQITAPEARTYFSSTQWPAVMHKDDGPTLNPHSSVQVLEVLAYLYPPPPPS